MAAQRRRGKGGPSTFSLALLALAMLVFGVGLGFLLSGTGCSRRKARPPIESTAPRPAPKAKGKGKPSPAPLPAPPPSLSATPESDDLPKVALVIDDFGYAPPELVVRLCAQEIAFSAAVLPYQEHTKVSAQIAHDRGKEVMLHLPMEPLGYPGPGKDPGPDAVMFALNEQETRARVRKALLEVPYRKGVNNHMGSRITPDRRRMTWVLEEVKRAGCFFVDSRTEKDSVAFDVAEFLKVPSVQRKVFLDDDKSFEEISKQWERALGIARKEGEVLIIGHIYPETVEALEKLIPRTRGTVRFVKASQLAQ